MIYDTQLLFFVILDMMTLTPCGYCLAEYVSVPLIIVYPAMGLSNTPKFTRVVVKDQRGCTLINND